MQSYRNVGHTDAIIIQTNWNSIVYTFSGGLVVKHPESHVLKLFSKELLFHFDKVQVLMVSYSFSEISGIQVLMGILSEYKGDSQVKTWASNYFERSLGTRAVAGGVGSFTCVTLWRSSKDWYTSSLWSRRLWWLVVRRVARKINPLLMTPQSLQLEMELRKLARKLAVSVIAFLFPLGLILINVRLVNPSIALSFVNKDKTGEHLVYLWVLISTRLESSLTRFQSVRKMQRKERKEHTCRRC